MRPLFTDEWALIGAIDPDNNTSSPTSSLLTDAIDMADYDQVAFIFQTGNFSAAGGTAIFGVSQATTSGGTYAAISALTATTLTGSPSDDDKQVIIICNATDLDMDNNYRWVKGTATISGAGTTDCSCVALGRAKKGPASNADLASVDEIKTS